ncbi:MAG: hypothetical protein QXE06_05365 [Candidatus Bathyarchaeia archaeon]
MKAVLEIVEGWGFEGEAATALARLIMYAYFGDDFPLSPEELEKWRSLNIIDQDGKILAEENPPDSIEWIMYGLAWEGLVKRVHPVRRRRRSRK